MWCRIKNLLLSIKTYRELSPDFGVRRQVRQSLSDRAALSPEQWFQTHWQATGISPTAATFAYQCLEKYAGLPFAKVLPGDRLEEDLCWTQVCGFDWEVQLCEDFWRWFEVDLSDDLADFEPDTVAELVSFLDRQLTQRNNCQNFGAEETNF